jgi:acetyl esterase/lipase
LTTGDRDRLRGDSEALAVKLQAAGVETELMRWPGLWHVFEFYDELPEALASLQAIAAFLVRHLARG